MIASDIPHVARHLLEKHGLLQQGWVFRWDSARRRAGCCWYRRKVIALSRHYVALNVAERLDDVVDTILHEIAHALAGPAAHHGPAWVAMCAQVGAVPKRCAAADVVMPKGRLTATCGGCGKVYRRHKQLQRGKWCYCLACGPERGRLTYLDTAVAPTVVVSSVAIISYQAPPTPRRLR